MNAVTQLPATTPAVRKSVTIDMANRFGMEPDAFEATVRATCMPSNRDGKIQATREEFAAFLLVAKEYDLNPLTREIYAFPRKGGGIVPIVSIDGWISLVNRQEQMDGVEFVTEHDDKGKLVSVTCRIHRKDRRFPVEVTEYRSECWRDTDAWRMEHRMLRHKALIQCARYAFGFAGIYDEDEAERFADARDITGQVTIEKEPPPAPARRRKAAEQIAPVVEGAPPQVVEQTGAALVERMKPFAAEPMKGQLDRIAEFIDRPRETASAEPAGAGDAADAQDAIAEGASPVGAEAVASDPIPEDEDEPEPFEPWIARVEVHCAAAQTLADMDDIEALYVDDLDRLTRSQREAYDYQIATARSRIEAATKPQIPAADPFAIPESVADIQAYREWVQVMLQSASTREHCARIRHAWKHSQSLRDAVGMSRAAREETKLVIQRVLATLEANDLDEAGEQ